MERLLELFKHCNPRDYKGGIEFRTHNLDHELSKAKSFIEKENLNVDIFEIDPVLKSFSVRAK